MPPDVALYDAHQHFHFDSLIPHQAAIAADLHAAGIRRAVVNGTNKEEWPVVSSLADRYPWIVPSYGVHPWDCGNRSSDYLATLRARLLAEPAAGVGEIGLDRWIIDGIRPDDPRLTGLRVAPLAEQGEVFLAQLSLAGALNRAASIHCVQAWGVLRELLTAAPRPERGFLLHGYGGPGEMVDAFAELGAYFSFNLELCQPRHAERLANFRMIPAERLLVETDAPTKAPPDSLNRYPLPPGPDGAPVNHPANLTLAYTALAELRGISLATLAAQVETNFRRLFL